MKHLIVTFVTVFGSLGSAIAQEADARIVKFRLLCYEHVNNVTQGLVTGKEGEKVEAIFYTGDFSPQSTAKFSGGKASFYTETTDAAGKPVRTVVAEGSLDASDTQVFLLVPSGKKEGPSYRVLSFDDKETSFAMGSTRVINLAPFSIRFTLAGQQLPAIKPGGMTVYPQVKKFDEWNMYTAQLDFGVKENEWVNVATQSWKSSDRKRDWVITRVDPTTQSPSIRVFQDVPPWRKDVLPQGQATP